MGLTKLLQLEEITLTFRDISYFTDANSFIKKLAKNCPKLRMVYFGKYQVFIQIFLVTQFLKVVILIILCLTFSSWNVIQLYLLDVLKFRSIELSKMSNLTELSMVYERATFDITIFCNFLRKMPKLKLLQLLARPYNEQFEFRFSTVKLFDIGRDFDVIDKIIAAGSIEPNILSN